MWWHGTAGGSKLSLFVDILPAESCHELVQSKRLKEHLASPGNALHYVILSSDSASWMDPSWTPWDVGLP